MGPDPAPFITDKFFNYYKRRWLLQTKKRDLRKARISSNIFRFIDDLYTFNNDEFESNYKDIS